MIDILVKKLKQNKLTILLVVFFLFSIYFVIDYTVHVINKEKILSKFPSKIVAKIDENIPLPQTENTGIIPYNLYRTYIDAEKAQKFNISRKMTLDKNPYLKEHFYSDSEAEQFVKDNYDKRVYDAYMKINPQYGPAKADFFRYLIIYKYGGIYLDIKSWINKNIKEYFDHQNKLIVSKGRNKSFTYNRFGIGPTLKNTYDWSEFSGIDYGEYNNWHFLAPAGDYLLGRTIQQIVSNIESNHQYQYGEYSVLVLTGPIMFTRVIEKYKNKNNVMICEPNLNKSVNYSYVDHKKGNKNHYSKLENKNVLLV